MMRLRLCLLVLLTVITVTCFSQKPDWIRNAEMQDGVYGTSSVKRVAIHPDGNVYVLTQYAGTLTFSGQVVTSPPNTFNDVLLLKYSSTGSLVWMKPVFQSQTEVVNSVLDLKVDYQGNLVFSGSCLWPASVFGSAIGMGQFIAKIDKDANLKWIDFPPLTGGAIAEHDIARKGNRIGFDGDNNILWFNDRINEYKLTGGLAVMKYKPDGTKIKTMFVTHSPNFYHPNLQDFSVNADGSFVISGNFETSVSISGGPTLTNLATTNPIQLFVASFTSDGNFKWAVYTNGESSVTTSHTADHLGNVYVAWSLGSGTIYATAIGGREVTHRENAISRISAEGRIEWTMPMQNQGVEDIHFAHDGLLYITGYAYGPEFKYQTYVKPMKADAAFILKVNVNGNFNGVYLGEPEDDPSTLNRSEVYGYQSVVDASGNIYTIGGFWDKQVWGCVPAVTKGYAMFLVKHVPAESPARMVSGPLVVCAGTTVSLSTDLVSNGVLYRWFTPHGADPAPGTELKNSIDLAVKESDDGQVVIASIKDNCDEYFAEPYVLRVVRGLVTPEVIGKNAVCPETAEEYRIAEVDESASYTWTLPLHVSAPALADEGGKLIFSSDFRGGELKISVSNHCGSKTTTFPISGYAPPEVPVLSGNLEICPGLTLFQMAIDPVVNAVAYLWELPSFISFDPLHPTNKATLHAQAISQFERGEIKVRAVGECTISQYSKPMIISRAPNPHAAKSLSGPEELCTTEGVVRYFTDPIENANEYSWSVPSNFVENGTRFTTKPFIDLHPKTAGSDSIVVRGKNFCNKMGVGARLAVTTYSPLQAPVVTASDCFDRLTITNLDDSMKIFWFVNGVFAPELTEKELILADSGSYFIQIENFCGMKQSNTIQAYPVLKSNVVAPNVITPNGDGKNEFLVIDRSLPDALITVTNRWGEYVYTSENYENDWSGDDLSSGTYFLTVRHRCLSTPYKGWLTVMK